MRERIGDFWRGLSWPKIVGETLIVVVGVFFGIQASNWNDARIERAESVRLLRNLQPELTALRASFGAVQTYYSVTRNYASTAFAGWRGDPGISDRDFVIAAYQASQNTFSAVNVSSWSTIFGSDKLRSLDDQKLREQLALLMTTDFAVLEKEVFTDYRENVRKVIPEDIQDAIRAQCGDQRIDDFGFVRLPPTCRLNLPDERFRSAAKALRDHPELVGKMRWHFAAVASYRENVANLEAITSRVLARIEKI